MFLILVLIRNPWAFFKAVAVVATNRFSQYVSTNLNVIQEATSVGLYVTPESRGFAFMYGAVHGVARAELYRASRGFALNGCVGNNSWRIIFGPVSARQLTGVWQLSAVINKMTGLIRYSSLGITGNQKAMEEMLLVPRYLRTTLGLLSDALQGDVRGNESRRTLLSTAVVTAVALLLVKVFS